MDNRERGIERDAGGQNSTLVDKLPSKSRTKELLLSPLPAGAANTQHNYPINKPVLHSALISNTPAIGSASECEIIGDRFEERPDTTQNTTQELNENKRHMNTKGNG
jgi:hypothetical protein